MECLPLPLDIINKIQLYVSTPEADMVRVAWSHRCCWCEIRYHPFKFDYSHTTELADRGYPIVCEDCVDDIEAELEAKKEKAMKQYLRDKIEEDKFELLELCRENDIPVFIGEIGTDNFDGSYCGPKLEEYNKYMDDYDKTMEHVEKLRDLALDEGFLPGVVMFAGWSVEEIFEEISDTWISDNWDFWDED